MHVIKCTIAYDGSQFSGFQVQPDKRTVQGELEKALKKIHKNKDIKIHASGRTDAGVHARAQVCHFETNLDISMYGWQQALLTLLPNDIQIKRIEKAATSFHSRYNAVEKEYRYFILNSKEPDVFKRNYMLYSKVDYDMDLMKQACKLFEGTHDFTSFSSAKSGAKGNKIRTLFQVDCEKNGEVICFIIRGDGFLRYMVRIIISTILEVGQGLLTIEDIKQIIEEENREAAPPTIPPQGLFLWEVTYE